MAKKLGYWELYVDPENPTFRTVLCMYASLAYVPLEHVHEYYGILSRHALSLFPDNTPTSITPFNEYFLNTYVGAPGTEGGKFKHKFWNVRDS